LKYVPFEYTENVLNSLKPVELIQRMLQLATPSDEEAIVLDFFGGSAVTAHAVLLQNLQDGGKRQFVIIQVDEPLPKPEQRMRSIFEMGLTRVRNVAEELRSHSDNNQLDIGFRVLKIDSSNLADVYYTPDAIRQDQLDLFTHNIKPDRTPEDLLFQVLLDWGVDLSLPIRKETLRGKTVFFVDENALVACFDDDVDEELVKELAGLKPLRVVFRDSGFASDAVKINVEQIFKQMSPGTEVKAI